VTWLTWRQYRMSTVISAALLAAFAVLVVITGRNMAAQFHDAFGSCLATSTCRFPNDNIGLGGGPLGFIIEFTLAVPAVLGMFIGAPLVAREIETGTGQFSWTQAVGWIRQHYMTPVTTKFSIGQDVPYIPKGAAWQLAQGFTGPNGPISLPNSDTVQIIGNGFPVSAVPPACHVHGLKDPTAAILSCLGKHGYAQYVTYQPAYRYWPFQFIEAGIFVALAAVLIALAFAVINRRDA
jgi:hypothetical protein